jgi:hypothetical protein
MILYRFTHMAAVNVVTGLALALAGCGGKPEPSKPADTKPADGKGNTPTSPSGGHPGTSGPAMLGPSDPAQKAAEQFVTDLRAAADKPGPVAAELVNRLSPAFRKVIGKPILTDADKQRGYSTDAAGAWLRRAAGPLTGIGLPTGYGSPAVAVFVGSFGNGTGRLLLRMVPGDGGWKVDWFSLGTAKAVELKPTSPDGPYQDFAAQAFLDALTGTATSKDDRALLLGAAISPKLRQAWAQPFDQDKARGYDFSQTKLAIEAEKLGGGVTAYALTPTGGDLFKAELTKGKDTKAYTLNLTKGTGPGEWLVDEFKQQ